MRIPAQFIACVALAACRSALHVDLPAPWGPLAIGRSVTVLEDSSRKDPWIPAEHRLVIVEAWYPAERGADGIRAPYLPNASKLPGPFDRGERFAAGTLRSHSIANAPVVPQRNGYPAILFSAGNDMATEYYSGIIEELVSNGYIVLAIDHAHEGKGQLLPDGRRLASEVERNRPADARAGLDFYRKRVEWRAQDGAYVVSMLVRAGARLPISTHVDTSRIAALGHSIGGVAAMEMCRTVPLLRACANLDGLILNKPDIGNATQPAPAQPLLFVGKRIFTTSPTGSSVAEAELRASLARGKSGAYRVLIDGTTHDSYSDVPFMTPTLRPVHKRTNLRMVRDVTLAFFGKTLQGRPAPLLDDSTSVAGGRVTITRIGPVNGAVR